MSASISDKITDTFNSANPNVAKVTGTRTALGATLTCDNLAGWPTASAVHFSTYQLDTSSKVIAGTQIDWKGIVSGNSIGTMTRQAGATDSGNSIGDVVEMNPTGSWAHDLFTAATAEHSQVDGTHTNITQADTNFIKDTSGNELLKWSKTTTAVNEVTIKNAATGAAPIVKASGSDAAVNLNLQGKGLAKTVTIGAGGVNLFPYDYVASGLVITADSVGVNKNYSMALGVVVINGNPITVGAVSAQTVGASKDRYIDILDNGDGTGLIVNTEVANNAASPALASNSIRVGIVVAGTTTIATTGSINQGQESSVLPIASSIPYQVADSLGNLICSRDMNRKLLGSRIITSNFTTATAGSQVDVTGINLTVNVTAGHRIQAVVTVPDAKSSEAAGNGVYAYVVDSTASANIGNSHFDTPTSSYTGNLSFSSYPYTPAASGARTFKLQAKQDASGTLTLTASATNPVCLAIYQL